jgi:sec-independent protein translocase protein TatA
MRAPEPWHLLVLATLFVALFGAKRLPESARSSGEAGSEPQRYRILR